MHHIHRTKGLILSSNSLKESDKRLSILTEKFGLLKVTAISVRSSKSKLRQSVQDYSFSEFALVCGKTGWRLTNAKFLDSGDKLGRKKFLIFAKILSLIERMVLGEEEDENLYRIINEAFQFLKNNNLDDDDLSGFEIIVLLKILASLGYLENDKNLANYLSSELDLDLIRTLDKELSKIAIKSINNAIRESGL